MANASFLLIFLFAFPIFVISQNNPSLVPTGYHLAISVPVPATSSDYFNGSVEINVTLSKTTTELVLDAEDLAVDPASVTVLRLRQGVADSWVNESRYTGVQQLGSLLTLSFSTLSKANYRIRLNYTGHFQVGSKGFIKAPFPYKDETRFIGVTNLEGTNARLVFPCFARVRHRTNFELDITVNKSDIVVSNVKHTYVHNMSESTKMFHFGSYPAMAVSQLGWAVLDMSTYVQHTAVTPHGAVVHTRAPHGYDNYTTWACTHTALLVEALGNYTQLFYPLPKLEQIVAPALPASTMEGWGILSYRKESLLMSPRESSTRDSHRILLELSRGVAGQWFQGITSMDSWNNEWFARGMKEYLKYTVAATLPEMSKWELQDHMVVEMVQTALALDSNERGMNETSSNAYKDGSIIRMLQSIVGDEIFRTSLIFYFDESNYTVSKPSDFFDKLEVMRTDMEVNVDLAGQTETQIMDSWIAAVGHPVVNVATNGSHYNISQSADSQVYVPITYLLQDNSTVMRTWLKPGSTVVVEGASSSKWILVNVNQTGFYRVNYDANLWALLSRQLASDLSQIPRLNRAQLIDDAFELTSQGLLSLDLLMNLTSYLTKEIDPFPWLTATRNYQHILDLLYNQTSHDLLQSHILRLMNTVIEEVGLETRSLSSHTEKLRQALILETACALGHTKCLKRAVSILNMWMSRTYYDPDLNMALLCAAVSNTSSSVWQELWSAYNVSVSPTVRINILKALSCSTNATLLKGFLKNVTSVSDPVLNSKNKDIFLSTLASTPRGSEIILDWIIETLTFKAAMSANMSSTKLSESESSTVNLTEDTLSSTPSIDLNSTAVSQASNTTIERTKREVTGEAMETLSEEEARTILTYALPKLTSLHQGTKLEKFFQETKLNWANETLEFLEEATTNIYTKYTNAEKFNGKMVVWLLNAITTATTSTSTDGTGTGATTTSDSTKTPVTPKPSAANSSYANLVVILLSVIVSFRATRSVVRC